MALSRINPEALSEPVSYSHAIVATGSRIVFLAGQVALDANGQVVGGDDVGAQAHQVYRNIATVLDAAGASTADVAKLTTYVVGHRSGLLHQVMTARRTVFGDHAPASTFIGVEALARPEYLIEVEAVAVLD